jgi:hypothetical protein
MRHVDKKRQRYNSAGAFVPIVINEFAREIEF